MADRVDVKLKAKDPNNETTTTTISYINPEATNGEMKAFAQRLNALTRNTYSESDKIETTNLDLAPSGGGVITPTLTLSESVVTLADFKLKLNTGAAFGAFPVSEITYTGDGTVYAFLNYESTDNTKYLGVSVKDNNGTLNLVVAGKADYAFPCTITIRADATETYKAVETTYTVT